MPASSLPLLNSLSVFLPFDTHSIFSASQTFTPPPRLHHLIIDVFAVAKRRGAAWLRIGAAPATPRAVAGQVVGTRATAAVASDRFIDHAVPDIVVAEVGFRIGRLRGSQRYAKSYRGGREQVLQTPPSAPACQNFVSALHWQPGKPLPHDYPPMPH